MAILEIRQLCKDFGGLAANREVSFDVQERSIVGLIGPNGAGKTTLFNCITGHATPTKGVILFEGIRLNGKRPDQICRLGMARTWQKVRPLAKMTVLENVMVGALLRSRSLSFARDLALAKLDDVGMAHRAYDLSGGLPIGERKKLEIARILATQPKLLLFDEIMGGLNPAESEDIIQLVFELRSSGLTQVVIEHDMQAIMRISDRIVALCSGEKLAEGVPAEIVNHPDVISAYLGGPIDA